jgi:hypothetical protein
MPPDDWGKSTLGLGRSGRRASMLVRGISAGQGFTAPHSALSCFVKQQRRMAAQ